MSDLATGTRFMNKSRGTAAVHVCHFLGDLQLHVYRSLQQMDKLYTGTKSNLSDHLQHHRDVYHFVTPPNFCLNGEVKICRFLANRYTKLKC